MRFRVILGLTCLCWAGRVPLGMASITYIDAMSSNTVLQGGAVLSPGSNCTTGPGDGPMDNSWHLRTDAGNGATVWTADETGGGSEDVTPLVTTITFSEAGGYQIFAYFWDSEDSGEDWDARVRLGSSGGFTKVQASEAEPADPGRFASSVLTSESPRRLVQVPLGVVIVTNGGTAQVCIDDDTTTGQGRTWYDGVGYEKVFSGLGENVIALDFNKTNVPGSPSQAMFRVINGSQNASQNSTVIRKQVGNFGIEMTKTNTVRFDFMGANGDATRTIPGGPTSLSFLVADFLGSRDGVIRIGLTNLPAGTYLFRSYHLEPLNTASLGYAQGTNSVTPNTLRAQIGGSLVAIVQPTAVGPAGLGTTFISDADIPKLVFPFKVDASGTATLELSSLYANGSTQYIFLNGFEVFATLP